MIQSTRLNQLRNELKLNSYLHKLNLPVAFLTAGAGLQPGPDLYGKA
jgi:hypothetical protein